MPKAWKVQRKNWRGWFRAAPLLKGKGKCVGGTMGGKVRVAP